MQSRLLVLSTLAFAACASPAHEEGPIEGRAAGLTDLEADDAPAIVPAGPADKVGKPRLSAARSVGTRPLVLDRALKGRPQARAVSLAAAPRARRPTPRVQQGLLSLVRRSTAPVYLELDPELASLRTFMGRVPNAEGRGARAARRMLEGALPSFGLSAPGGDLELVERERQLDADGGLNLVYDLRLGGLTVWLAELRAQFDGAGALTAVHAEGLTTLQPPRELRLGPQAAERRAAASLIGRSATGTLAPGSAPELGIWVGQEGGQRAGVPSWRIAHRFAGADGSPRGYHSYIDAVAGALLGQHPTVYTQNLGPTLEATRGSAADHDGSALDLDIALYTEDDVYVLLDGTRAGHIWTQHAGNLGGTETTGEQAHAFPLMGSRDAGDWPADHAAAHHGIGRVLDYFSAQHQRNSWDGQGGDVHVAVHLGRGMDNAFFSDDGKPFIGVNDDGVVFRSFARCLDVLGHELTHGVVATTAGLVYLNQSGALNESISDVMGVMIDTDDWTIGEHCRRGGSGIVRDVEDPSRENQPAHMRDFQDLPIFTDNGGVHINSGIPNRAAFLATQETSRELVGRVWYRTLSRHLTRLSTFDEMARATGQACDELVALDQAQPTDCEAVTGAWVAVGVLGVAQGQGAACPNNSSEQGGVCACEEGFTPSADGTMCIAYAQVQCPDNSVQVAGQCYCEDGFFALGSDCVQLGTACPSNSSPNAFGDCQCDEGFQGSPFGLDGGCVVVSSDCPDNSHPEWPDPNADPDAYDCLCNRGYVADAVTSECVIPPGGCGAETFYGRCSGQDLVYCGPDGIERVDCAGADLVCGLVDSRIGFDCLNPNGLDPAASCDPSAYQECGADTPFCVADSDDLQTGFCSNECTSQLDCGDAYGCCATVSDGSRACLTAGYCESLLDLDFACDDVQGGSTYYGACDGNTLVYCDPSTESTLRIPCIRDGKVCGFAGDDRGYNCLSSSSAVIEAPEDWCPFDDNGRCDAPERCPDGTDLLDCNPCGEVTEDGRCDGDRLELCDPEAGLVVTDCSELPEPGRCDGSGPQAACAGGGGPASDAGVGGDGGAPADAGRDDPEEEDEAATASCSCRVGPGAGAAAGPAWLALFASLLIGVRLRRRWRRRAQPSRGPMARSRAPARSAAP